MDGSLVGIDFTPYITAAWAVSGLLMAGLAAWATVGYLSASRKTDHDGH